MESEMKENLETEKTRATQAGPGQKNRAAASPAQDEESAGLPFDPWRLVQVLRRRAPLLAVLALLGGAGLFFLMPKTPEYRAIVKILRLDVSSDLKGERQQGATRYSWLSPETVMGFLVSPDLMRRVSEESGHLVAAEELAGRLEILPEESAAIIGMQITGQKGPDELVRVANYYAEEFCKLTEEVKSREAHELNNQLKETLDDVDREIKQAHESRVEFLQKADLFDYDKETDAFLAHRSQLDRDIFTANMEMETTELKISSLRREILLLKRGEIDRLLVRYTESHPVVQDALAEFATLEKQLMNESADSVARIEMGSPVATGLLLKIIDYRIQKVSLQKNIFEIDQLRDRINEKLALLSEKMLDYGKIKSHIQSLELTRSLVAGRQREADLIEKYPPRLFQPLRALTSGDVSVIPGWFKPAVVSFLLALFLFLGGASVLGVIEIADDRIKTVQDLRRVSGLPVVARLADLKRLNPDQKTAWAFRTWTLLSGKLKSSQADGHVLGLISAGRTEGVSTWLQHLSGAACQRGFTTLVLSLRPAGKVLPLEEGPAFSGPDWLDQAGEFLAAGSSNTGTAHPPENWIWTVERLQQGKRFIREAEERSGQVILVELPEAGRPETVPLAAALPHVIWLAGSGKVDSRETAMHLETLRSGACHISVAVLNREPEAPLALGLPKWLRRLTFLLALAAWPAAAQESSTNGAVAPLVAGDLASTNQFFSVVSTKQRAPWQTRLTLGPGDVMNLALYGHETSARSNVKVGPDGRLSYLQAQDVMAMGLTVDELRALLEVQLSAYYRRPNVIITPVGFASKKYVLLGAVTQRGVFTLNRPLTIIEAVARAGGLVSQSKADLSIVEMADPSRSFLIRDGRKFDLDMESLFFEGDLTQNIPLQPGDFIYFAPAVQNEVYVLGSVAGPGVVLFNEETTLLGAITERGGFLSGAYLKKVLVVRGSLTRPETYIVNASDIFKGKAPDFRLQRKDIIYVSSNPWNIVGQVLDMAVRSYIYGVTVTWSAFNVNQNLDSQPYIPSFNPPPVKVN